MDIDVYMDHVIVNGVRVERPARISRSDWMAWWERCK